MALAVSGPVLSLPLVAFAPLQAPLAVQAVALVDDQLSVLAWPLSTLDGSAVRVTVGAGDEDAGRCQPTGL